MGKTHIDGRHVFDFCSEPMRLASREVRLAGDTSMIRLVNLAQQLPRVILPAPLQFHQDWLHEPVSARPSLATAMLKPSVQERMRAKEKRWLTCRRTAGTGRRPLLLGRQPLGCVQRPKRGQISQASKRKTPC